MMSEEPAEKYGGGNCAVRAQPVGRKQRCKGLSSRTGRNLTTFPAFYGPVIPDGIKNPPEIEYSVAVISFRI